MSQHITVEDLSTYLDGAMSPARRQQIDDHLAACTGCRTALAELEWTVGFARSMPLAQMPPRAPLRVAQRRRSVTVPRWWLPATAVAAAVVVAVLSVGRWVPFGTRALLEGLDQGQPVGSAASARQAPEESLGSVPTPDSAKAGYPAPLATSRQDDISRVGGVPPPELPGYMSARDGATTPSLAAAARTPAGSARAPSGGLGAEPAPAAGMAPGQGPVLPSGGEVAGGAAEAGSPAAPSAPPTGSQAVPAPGLALGPAAVVAVALLLLSAALFVRASRR